MTSRTVSDQVDIDESHGSTLAKDSGCQSAAVGAQHLNAVADPLQGRRYGLLLQTRPTSAARRLRRRVSSRALSCFGRSSP